MTNTDIYVVVFIIVSAVFIKTSCVFLIYLLISLHYLCNIFFFFERKEDKYQTERFTKMILNPFRDNNLDPSKDKSSLDLDNSLVDDIKEDSKEEESDMQELLIERYSNVSKKSLLSKKSMFSMMTNKDQNVCEFESSEKEFLSRKNRLELCYLFYKQIEYQRLLFFNIFFGVFYIAACKVMILYQKTGASLSYDSPNINFVLKFFGFETVKDSFGNSINFFVFLNMVFLVLNKIFIENLKLDQRVKQQDKSKDLLNLIKSKRPSKILKRSSIQIQPQISGDILEVPGKPKEESPENENENKEEYKYKAHLLEYYSSDLLKLRIVRFLIKCLPFLLLFILLMINIFNENIFTLLLLGLLLLNSSPKKQKSSVLILLVCKLIIVYISYLMFFDGTSLSPKESSITLYTLFLQYDWIKLIFFDIIIGKNFKLAAFFIECMLILFFVFSQKIQMFFHRFIEKVIVSPRRAKLLDFSEHISSGQDISETTLPKSNYFPVICDYLYAFFICNVYSFLFGISLFLLMLTSFDIFNLIWVFVSFSFFVKYELFWDRRNCSLIHNEGIVNGYANSISNMKWILNLIIIFLQTIRFLASRFAFLKWLDDNLTNFSYLLVVFFIILVIDQLMKTEPFEKTLSSFSYFESVRKNFIVRMKVNESFIKTIERKIYTLILNENKRFNLKKLFSIIGKQVINKKRKDIIESGGTMDPAKSVKPKDFALNSTAKSPSLKQLNLQKMKGLTVSSSVNSDEIINIYTLGMMDIIKTNVHYNKYYYFNLFEQIEYMLLKMKIDMNVLDKYEFLCDFAMKKIKTNKNFMALKKKLNKNPSYIETSDYKTLLSGNIFNIDGERPYLEDDPSMIFKIKRWLFHWVLMNIDYFAKLVIILLCTLDGSLLMKLPVIYFLFLDLCKTVSRSRYTNFFFFFITMYFLKTVSFFTIPMVSSTTVANYLASSVHAIVGDFSTLKTLTILFFLIIIHLMDKYKGKETFYKFFVKNNIFTVFAKIHEKNRTLERVLTRYFTLPKSLKDTKEKRIQFVFFKIKLVYFYKLAKKRMYSYMKNRYLFNVKMGPNFKNIEENIFHPFIFKSGIGLYNLIIITQLIFIVFMFIFWNSMFTSTSNIMESITSSELSGGLVFFVLIAASCILIDAILINTNCAEYNKIQNFQPLPNKRDGVLRHFKSIVLKIVNINRIRKKSVLIDRHYDLNTVKKVSRSLSRINPTFPKFIFTLILWVSFNLFFLGMLFSKKLGLAKISNLPIKDFMISLQDADNIFVLLAEILFLLYTLISMLFVRHGLRMIQFYKSDQLNNIENKIMDKLNNLPYFRELRVYLFWTARKTSLDFKNWFTIDYCYFQMMKKFDKDYEYRNEIKPKSKLYKLFFGLGPLIIILLILLGPLVIFSSFNPINNPNEIKTFNADFSIEIDNLGFFSLYKLGIQFSNQQRLQLYFLF